MRRPDTAIVLLLVALVAPALSECAEELCSPPRCSDPAVLNSEVSREGLTTSFTVDTRDRFQVQAFFHWVYEASEDVPIEWTGSVAMCSPGSTSSAYEEATIRRVNYFRAMAGLPGDATLDPQWNAKCQKAALMMSAQGGLSHDPGPSWKCYSEEGKEAAMYSNLSGGVTGPQAVDDYIADPGDHNYFVGHRRWVLYPRQKVMGTGSVPSSTVDSKEYWSSNALWVIGGFGPRPPSPEWVAWPPQGYVPYQVAESRLMTSYRWSFSYPGADFSSASVTMTESGKPVSLQVLPLDRNDMGYADNTIVWEPSGIPSGPPPADKTYTVNVSNVVIQETPRDFTYNVTIIDPDNPPPSLKVTGVRSSVAGTATITFMDSGTGVSGYELQTTAELSKIPVWVVDHDAEINPLGAGRFEANTTTSSGAQRLFYRIKGK